MSKPWKILMLCASLTVVGCGTTTDEEEAQNAVETTESSSNESALLEMAQTDGTTSTCSFSSEQVADAALGRFKLNLKDASCVTSTRNGKSVDYVLNACTGKWGRVTVTGTVNIDYTMNSDCSVDAHATGTGISINKATVDLDSTAHYSKDANGLETVVVNSHLTGGNGNVEADHHGSYTVTRDADECRTLDGNWNTDWTAKRGSAMTSTTATGLKKCGDACPAAGGKVVHDGLFGRVITLSFDGSAVAKWETNKGKSGTINLPCGQ